MTPTRLSTAERYTNQDLLSRFYRLSIASKPNDRARTGVWSLAVFRSPGLRKAASILNQGGYSLTRSTTAMIIIIGLSVTLGWRLWFHLIWPDIHPGEPARFTNWHPIYQSV